MDTRFLKKVSLASVWVFLLVLVLQFMGLVTPINKVETAAAASETKVATSGSTVTASEIRDTALESMVMVAASNCTPYTAGPFMNWTGFKTYFNQCAIDSLKNGTAGAWWTVLMAAIKKIPGTGNLSEWAIKNLLLNDLDRTSRECHQWGAYWDFKWWWWFGTSRVC